MDAVCLWARRSRRKQWAAAQHRADPNIRHWNLFHVILPVVTNPNSPGGTQTGLGGLQLYNLSTIKLHGTTYGAGPLVVLPTESGSHFGTEKWQAGVGGVAIDATKWGLLGGLFTYQHAFGKGTGAITQETTFQPFIHYNLHHGLYLRSTGLLVFNSGSGVKDIPVGLGFGKVSTRTVTGTTRGSSRIRRERFGRYSHALKISAK